MVRMTSRLVVWRCVKEARWIEIILETDPEGRGYEEGRRIKERADNSEEGGKLSLFELP